MQPGSLVHIIAREYVAPTKTRIHVELILDLTMDAFYIVQSSARTKPMKPIAGGRLIATQATVTINGRAWIAWGLEGCQPLSALPLYHPCQKRDDPFTLVEG